MKLDTRSKAIWFTAAHIETADLIRQAKVLREEAGELTLKLHQTRLKMNFQRAQLQETVKELHERACQMKSAQPTK